MTTASSALWLITWDHRITKDWLLGEAIVRGSLTEPDGYNGVSLKGEVILVMRGVLTRVNQNGAFRFHQSSWRMRELREL